MQQELWLRAKSQVLSSIGPVCALRAATTAPSCSSAHFARGTDHSPSAAMFNNSPSSSNRRNTPTYPLPHPGTPNLGVRTRTLNNAHSHSHHQNRDNGVKSEFKRSGSAEVQTSLVKSCSTHQDLHKELLLAHKKGLGLSCKPELHQVLEKRKKEQSQKEEGEQTRTPLDEVLLRRQQKDLEREKQEEVRVREEAQLMEFVRVRQNLRKIHTVFHKTTNSPATDDLEQIE